MKIFHEESRVQDGLVLDAFIMDVEKDYLKKRYNEVIKDTSKITKMAYHDGISLAVTFEVLRITDIIVRN